MSVVSVAVAARGVARALASFAVHRVIAAVLVAAIAILGPRGLRGVRSFAVAPVKEVPF